MKTYISILVSMLLAVSAFSQQFRLVGNPSGFPTQINDSTYTFSVDFASDQTGNGFLPTQIDSTFRMFFQNEKVYQIDSIANATFSSADLWLVEYGDTDGQPSGQGLVYDPQNSQLIPQTPANSAGASPLLNAAIFTANLEFSESSSISIPTYQLAFGSADSTGLTSSPNVFYTENDGAGWEPNQALWVANNSRMLIGAGPSSWWNPAALTILDTTGYDKFEAEISVINGLGANEGGSAGISFGTASAQLYIHSHDAGYWAFDQAAYNFLDRQFDPRTEGYTNILSYDKPLLMYGSDVTGMGVWSGSNGSQRIPFYIQPAATTDSVIIQDTDLRETKLYVTADADFAGVNTFDSTAIFNDAAVFNSTLGFGNNEPDTTNNWGAQAVFYKKSAGNADRAGFLVVQDSSAGVGQYLAGGDLDKIYTVVAQEGSQKDNGTGLKGVGSLSTGDNDLLIRTGVNDANDARAEILFQAGGWAENMTMAIRDGQGSDRDTVEVDALLTSSGRVETTEAIHIGSKTYDLDNIYARPELYIEAEGTEFTANTNLWINSNDTLGVAEITITTGDPTTAEDWLNLANLKGESGYGLVSTGAMPLWFSTGDNVENTSDHEIAFAPGGWSTAPIFTIEPNPNRVRSVNSKLMVEDSAAYFEKGINIGSDDVTPYWSKPDLLVVGNGLKNVDHTGVWAHNTNSDGAAALDLTVDDIGDYHWFNITQTGPDNSTPYLTTMSTGNHDLQIGTEYGIANGGTGKISFEVGGYAAGNLLELLPSPNRVVVSSADLIVSSNSNCVIEGTLYLNAAKSVGIFTGTGTPEGSVVAAIGSTFHRTDGGANTSYYVKESGTGNTGWVAK